MWINMTDEMMDAMDAEMGTFQTVTASKFVGQIISLRAKGASAHVGEARCPACGSGRVDWEWSGIYPSGRMVMSAEIVRRNGTTPMRRSSAR